MPKNKKILSLEDLCNFYSTKKKSMSFSSEKTGYNVCVQVNASFEVEDSDMSEGLLFGSVKAFHDLDNLNKSYIDTEVFKKNIASLKDRPIMADIIETDKEDSDGNKIKDFNGHTMELDEETGKIIYVELPVGHFINPDNFKVEYDEEHERNFVIADCVIYEEYTEACEIIRRRKEVSCSVELIIRDMSWNAKDKLLVINDFYVQGCTLLGENVKPGMAGSKLTLKDFSEQNNSLINSNSEEENNKLIDTLEQLNATLKDFNINKENQGKEEQTQMRKEEFNNEEEVVEEVDTTTEAEDTEGTPEVGEDEACGDKKKEEESTEEDFEDEDTEGGTDGTGEDDEDDEEDDDGNEDEINDVGKKSFTKTFELSHDDVRYGLYELLMPYEEVDNTWYWISDVYDTYFVYEGYPEKIYRQDYTVAEDVVSFEGERVELFKELLTASEKAELESMRSNYSSISEELNTYKEIELMAKKEEILSDSAYADFMEAEEFKAIKEKISDYSLDELKDKCELAFASCVRKKGAFSLDKEAEKKETKSKPMFAFAKTDRDSSFLDKLLG